MLHVAHNIQKLSNLQQNAKSSESLLKERDWKRLRETKPNQNQRTAFAVKLHVQI